MRAMTSTKLYPTSKICSELFGLIMSLRGSRILDLISGKNYLTRRMSNWNVRPVRHLRTKKSFQTSRC